MHNFGHHADLWWGQKRENTCSDTHMHAHLSVLMQQRTTSRPRAAAQFQPNRLSLASKKSQNPLQRHRSHQITSCSLRLLSGLPGRWSLPLLIYIEIACSNTEMIAQVWPGNSMSTHPCLLLFHQRIKLEVEAAFFLTGGVCFWVSALKGWPVRKNSSSPRRAGRRQPRMENGADF